MALTDKLTAIADAIRAKTGGAEKLSLDGMVIAIEGIEGGAVLPDLTNPATASDLLASKELIDEEGNVITGTMVDNGSVDGSFDGINTTTYTVPAGYTSGGTVSLTDDIPNEVSTQADLIAQIQEVLSVKAAYNTVYVSATEPTADFGVNGDIYIVRSDS